MNATDTRRRALPAPDATDSLTRVAHLLAALQHVLPEEGMVDVNFVRGALATAETLARAEAARLTEVAP